VEVRYKLHGGRDVEVLRSAVANLADGHLHTATVTRLADTVSIQVQGTHTHTHARTHAHTHATAKTSCCVALL